MKRAERAETEWLLGGLDGGNPLAFLAALGFLRVIDSVTEFSPVKMSWVEHTNGYRPIIHLGVRITEHDLLEGLVAKLVARFDDHPVAQLENCDGRNAFVQCALSASLDDRDLADFITALKSELVADGTSQLQTVRRDYFIGNLRSVIENTQREHLERALFYSWDYSDALNNQSLHLDPSEDRRHAYQWHRPTSDPTRSTRGGMLGANRLALEAYPLFPSWSYGDKLATLGFQGTRAKNTQWSWPIWQPPLSLPVLWSLLAVRELQAEEPRRAMLRPRGVLAVYRSRRIVVGKTPNLTPPRVVMA